PGDLARPAELASIRMGEAELQVEWPAGLLARRLGSEIARAIFRVNGVVPVVQQRPSGLVYPAEQAFGIATEDLGAAVVVAMLDQAQDAAAEDDVVQVLDQGAEPALAFASRVLAVLLM